MRNGNLAAWASYVARLLINCELRPGYVTEGQLEAFKELRLLIDNNQSPNLSTREWVWVLFASGIVTAEDYLTLALGRRMITKEEHGMLTAFVQEIRMLDL